MQMQTSTKAFKGSVYREPDASVRARLDVQGGGEWEGLISNNAGDLCQ